MQRSRILEEYGLCENTGLTPLNTHCFTSFLGLGVLSQSLKSNLKKVTYYSDLDLFKSELKF